MSLVPSEQELLQMAGREPLGEDPREEEPAGMIQLVEAGCDLPYIVAETGKSGYSTFVEILIGAPSDALSLRRSLLGPYAAVGKAAYSLRLPGELSGWSPLTLDATDRQGSHFGDCVARLRQLLTNRGIALLSRETLSAAVPASVEEASTSLLTSIEGRDHPVFYDVVFQFYD